jgi:hypothetical protein
MWRDVVVLVKCVKSCWGESNWVLMMTWWVGRLIRRVERFDDDQRAYLGFTLSGCSDSQRGMGGWIELDALVGGISPIQLVRCELNGV